MTDQGKDWIECQKASLETITRGLDRLEQSQAALRQTMHDTAISAERLREAVTTLTVTVSDE